MSKKLTKEEFLEKLKTDRDFNNRYGRNHITEGKMVLPPCHYGFQVYTRELTWEERYEIHRKYITDDKLDLVFEFATNENLDKLGVPTRAISLMWNQRSVDTFLGLPFNIASYGLLLEIIAKEVNMVPDELIGNLGDVHLYSNHIDAAKEQIGRELTLEERFKLAGNQYPPGGLPNQAIYFMDEKGIPKRTREPFALPTLACLDEYWYLNDTDLTFIQKMEKFRPDFFKVGNYQSHPTIKAPLSN